MLTGKPGTGKTFTEALAALETHRLPYSSIAVAAPTGKAAVRCTAAMQSHGLDVTATTIHRLLGIYMDPDHGWRFMYDSANHLPYTHVFIDEASMLGTGLASSLFSACGDNTHLMLVGDPYQLPPVEHGAPLRDLMKLAPHGHLSQIRRNSGEIVRACHDIADGKMYHPYDKLDVDNGINLIHREIVDPNDQVKFLMKLYENVPKKYDPKWDVQPIVPLNKKSVVGRQNLNRMLQNYFNRHGQQNKHHRWRRGDKILCMRNTSGKDRKQNAAHFVANGEVGEIVQIEDNRIFAQFPDPLRLCVIPLGKENSEEGAEVSDGTRNSDFDLGYILTVHKSQGSQWPVVVCMVDQEQAARLVGCREFWYTALSRAEHACFTVGQRRFINQDLQKTALQKRKTLLEDRVLAKFAA